MRSITTRRHFLLAAASTAISARFPAPMRTSRSFWVLRLLQPTARIVRPVGTAHLHSLSSDGVRVIENPQSLSITASSTPIQITGPDNEPVHCMLEIPKTIHRAYFGTFQFFTDSQTGIVVPIVTIDCEIATASIVEAELPLFALHRML